MIVGTLVLLGVSIVMTSLFAYYYIGKDVKKEVTITLSIVLLITLSSLIFTILDSIDSRKISESENIKILWLSVYWVAYALSYIFIPFFKSYETADGFTFKEKAWKSIKANLIWYLVYIVIFSALLVWLFVKGLLDFQNLLAILTSISNAFGILIIIALIGYGLVQLPKEMIGNISLRRSTDYCSFLAMKFKEEFAECEKKIILFDKVRFVK